MPSPKGIRCAFCRTPLKTVRQKHTCKCVSCHQPVEHVLDEARPPSCNPPCTLLGSTPMLDGELDSLLHSVKG